jgi:hypothetical protein
MQLCYGAAMTALQSLSTCQGTRITQVHPSVSLELSNPGVCRQVQPCPQLQ